ncbi:MAG: Hsp20/alpha crystallin family protein [Lachnospiraceae bacterium]|nr:Hsp20/alpha crystallin family protein [Clostridiales bacterium]MCC8080504.1 Hsp20/alpha crystallin family protein [Lachnospiraceae bacterium]
MLRPSIYREDLWDDFFDDFFHEPVFHGNASRGQADLMRTDVKENESAYELTMNLPGVKKEDVKAKLKDGYLTIQATTDSSNDQKDDGGKYVRRERFSGTYSRSFYVGETVKQEDIKAKFENGTLILTVPKKVQQPVVEENKYIAIE